MDWIENRRLTEETTEETLERVQRYVDALEAQTDHDPGASPGKSTTDEEANRP